jgi:hypothetical protein
MPEPSEGLVFRRSAEFTTLYANNVQFESSVWDLKLIFGELDQSANPHSVEQHTAVILPWQQAILTAYYLIVNAMIHEAGDGKVPLPPRIIPVRPDPADPALDQIAKKVFTHLAWIHDQFFGPNPFVPPDVSAPTPLDQDPGK